MSEQRYIPSVDSLREAMSQLPMASTWRGDAYELTLSNGRKLTFRRIKMKDRQGKGHRWVFDGKVSLGEGGSAEEDKGLGWL